jgi:hypothetical protein
MSAAALTGPPFGAAVVRLREVLDRILEDTFDQPDAQLPVPTVSLTSVAEGAVGIGGYRGTESRSSFLVVALKGIRLDAVARFQLWARQPGEADDAAATLYAGVLAARDRLRREDGVLRIQLDATFPVERLEAFDAWRKNADYRVLFEFAYADADGADSLIARIPVRSDLEAPGSLGGETTTVTDELVRWDNESAPDLVVKGPLALRGIAALAFVAGGGPTGEVILTRTFDGATGPPTEFAGLDAFLDALAGQDPPVRHGRLRFASVAQFLAALGASGAALALGDWDTDQVLDPHLPRLHGIDPAIELRSAADRFAVAYAHPALDQVAVVYLRAGRG